MSNHPNRKGRIGIPPSSPTPDQVRDVRLAAYLTQTEAAEMSYVTLRTWQKWEWAERTMPAASWELFLLKISWLGVDMPTTLAEHIERIQISPLGYSVRPPR